MTYSTMTTRKNIAERINNWTKEEMRFTSEDSSEKFIKLTQQELDDLKEKVFSNLNKGLSENLEVWTNKATGLTYFRTYRNMYGDAIMVVSDEEKAQINEEKAQMKAEQEAKKAQLKQEMLDKLHVWDELTEIPRPEERVSRSAVSRYFEALVKKHGDMFVMRTEDKWYKYATIDRMKMDGYNGRRQCYVRCDIRSNYDWDELEDMRDQLIDFENGVAINAEHVYIEAGLAFMGDMTPEEMNMAADQMRAVAQITEKFNERMKDVLVVY